MSADVLRQAAALMRERAQAATPGPWESLANGDRVVAWRMDPTGQFDDEWDDVIPEPMDSGEDAEHIASWHPAVALAVAKFLDEAANAFDLADICLDCAHPSCLAVAEAFDVARAYLGESA